MSNQESVHASNAAAQIRPDFGRYRPLQTPPDVKIALTLGPMELIRVVALGTDRIGPYEPQQEYWCCRSACLRESRPHRLRMRVSPLSDCERTEQWIEAFFSGYCRGGIFPRVVASEDWKERDACATHHGRPLLCFRPRRGEDCGFWLGVEWDDDTGMLSAFSWYRDTRPENGRAFEGCDFSIDMIAADPAHAPRYYFRQRMSG